MGNSGGRVDREAHALERVQEALRLKREEKLTYQEIAERMGFRCKSHAYQLVKRGMAKLHAETVEEARKYRDELNEAVDLDIEHHREIVERFMRKAKRGVGSAAKIVLEAQDRLTALYALRAKLVGAMAPVKTEVTGKDGGPIAVGGAPTPADAARAVAAVFGDKVAPTPKQEPDISQTEATRESGTDFSS